MKNTLTHLTAMFIFAFGTTTQALILTVGIAEGKVIPSVIAAFMIIGGLTCTAREFRELATNA